MPHPVKTGFFENPLLNSQEAFWWRAGAWVLASWRLAISSHPQPPGHLYTLATEWRPDRHTQAQKARQSGGWRLHGILVIRKGKSLLAHAVSSPPTGPTSFRRWLVICSVTWSTQLSFWVFEVQELD